MRYVDYTPIEQPMGQRPMTSLLSVMLDELRGKAIAIQGDGLNGLLGVVVGFDGDWLLIRTPDGTRRIIRLADVHQIEDGPDETKQYDFKAALHAEFEERSWAADQKQQRAKIATMLERAGDDDDPRPSIGDPEGFLRSLMNGENE